MTQYGRSILEVTPKIEDDGSGFSDSELTDKDLEQAYGDMEKLKQEGATKKIDRVLTDPLTGMRAASEAKIDNTKSFSDIINERKNLGKKINISGLNLIKQLVGHEPDDTLISSLSNLFDTVKSEDDIKNIGDDKVKDVLGEEITTALYNKIFVKKELPDVIKQFLCQIYTSYIHEIQYNDDVATLTKAVAALDSMNKGLDKVSSMKTLKDIKGILDKTMSEINSLDTGKYKKRYSINDVDLLVIEDIRQCLNDALAFKDLYNTVDTERRLRREVKKDYLVEKTVSGWLRSINSDNDTLYTFPITIDAYHSPKQASDALIDFVFRIIMLDRMSQYYVEEDAVDLVQFYKDKGYMTDSDEETFRYMARSLVYVLAKTYDIMNVKTEKQRRMLSYTLDIISKAVIKEYRADFMTLVEYIYSKVSKSDVAYE